MMRVYVQYDTNMRTTYVRQRQDKSSAHVADAWRQRAHKLPAGAQNAVRFSAAVRAAKPA